MKIIRNFIARTRPVGADPVAFKFSSALIPVVTTNVSVISQPTPSSITYTTAGQSSLTSSSHSTSSSQPVSTTQTQSTLTSTVGASTSTSNLAICKRHSIKSRNKVDNHRDLIVCIDVSKCGNYLITGMRSSMQDD